MRPTWPPSRAKVLCLLCEDPITPDEFKTATVIEASHGTYFQHEQCPDMIEVPTQGEAQ